MGIKEVGWYIKFVNNWSCFYKFSLQEKELADVYIRVFIRDCRKRCKLIRGMLFNK